MEETNIDEIGKAEFGRRWARVFASDEAKKLLHMKDCFAVVNTATSRGRGSHWLGVCMTSGGSGYYEQRGTSAVCGHLSLSWLLTVRDVGIRATAAAV